MTGVAGQPVLEPRPRIAAVLKNAAGVTIELLDNGAVFAIRHGDILVNQVLGSPVEGGLGNLYLRRRNRGGATFVPLLGPAAGGRFRADGDGATWEGSFDGLDYACTLRLHPTAPTWFWTVEVTNRTDRRLSVDTVLAQDLGLAAEDVVRSSEAYTSQYIDHAVLRAGDLGVVVCSRQNMAQAGSVPWVMHGCLDGAAGFLTDGVQLYGLEYRATNVPAVAPSFDACRTASTSTSSRFPPSAPAPSRCRLGRPGESPSSRRSRPTTRRPLVLGTWLARSEPSRPSRASPRSSTPSSRGPGPGRPGSSTRRSCSRAGNSTPSSSTAGSARIGATWSGATASCCPSSTATSSTWCSGRRS